MWRAMQFEGVTQVTVAREVQAFAEFSGLLLATGMAENGRDTMALGVEEFVGDVGNRQVARDEEGTASSGTKQGAFSANGANVKKKMPGKGIEDGMRRN